MGLKPKPVATLSCPRILYYLDYRAYLKDYYAFRRSRDGDFSQRVFAKEVGIALVSSSLIPAILNGQRNMSPNLRIKFGKALGLSERDYRYFDLLVQFNQAKGMTEKNFFFSHLAKFRTSRAQILDETQYRFFSRWYYSAVWNYFGIYQNRKHPGIIGASMVPPISSGQVEESVKLLLELGLIKKTAAGYAVTEKHIYTEKDVQAMAVRQQFLELMGMAVQVLDTVPPEERQYNSLMFSISPAGFNSIKDRIRSFQEEVREIIDHDAKEDRIYTLNMQLFPNSKASP